MRYILLLSLILRWLSHIRYANNINKQETHVVTALCEGWKRIATYNRSGGVCFLNPVIVDTFAECLTTYDWNRFYESLKAVAQLWILFLLDPHLPRVTLKQHMRQAICTSHTKSLKFWRRYVLSNGPLSFSFKSGVYESTNHQLSILMRITHNTVQRTIQVKCVNMGSAKMLSDRNRSSLSNLIGYNKSNKWWEYNRSYRTS